MQSDDKMTRSTESSTDNLTNAEECPICHKVGFHKLSCSTQKVTVFIPTLEGDEAEEFIRKADENVRLMRQRLCKNHVWRNDYINGGKVCQVCMKKKEDDSIE